MSISTAAQASAIWSGSLGSCSVGGFGAYDGCGHFILRSRPIRKLVHLNLDDVLNHRLENRLSSEDLHSRTVTVADGFEITLPCSTIVGGRPIPVSIQLITLNQSKVYAGLIEGIPTEEMNQRIIEGAVRDVNKGFEAVQPYLIIPKQEPLDIGREYPLGKPAMLPNIQCTAFFRCVFPTPYGTPHDYSYMTIIWFQKEYAMPIDYEVMAKIRAIDWLNLATNAEW